MRACFVCQTTDVCGHREPELVEWENQLLREYERLTWQRPPADPRKPADKAAPIKLPLRA